MFAGDGSDLPPELVLPVDFRLDVDRASDVEVVDAVASLIAVYVEQLVFSQDDESRFNGSPYDEFLRANHLPAVPRGKETPASYTARLRRAVRKLRAPVFVSQGPFEFHAQDRVFGPAELRGLRVFLEPAPARIRPRDLERGGIGNCAACHTAPTFTDFGFHNTGVTQVEYDTFHGSGQFAALEIPRLLPRNEDPNAFLPATALHPNAAERFRAPATAGDPSHTDLGVWNIVANPDMPAVQEKLLRNLCRQAIERGDRAVLRKANEPAPPGFLCSTSSLLQRAIASFKTPGLRDLSHSAPYMHNGEFDSLEAVLAFYDTVSTQAREGLLRNAPPELRGIVLRDGDADAIASFLRSLNEDYN